NNNDNDNEDGNDTQKEEKYEKVEEQSQHANNSKIHKVKFAEAKKEDEEEEEEDDDDDDNDDDDDEDEDENDNDDGDDNDDDNNDEEENENHENINVNVNVNVSINTNTNTNANEKDDNNINDNTVGTVTANKKSSAHYSGHRWGMDKQKSRGIMYHTTHTQTQTYLQKKLQNLVERCSNEHLCKYIEWKVHNDIQSLRTWLKILANTVTCSLEEENLLIHEWEEHLGRDEEEDTGYFMNGSEERYDNDDSDDGGNVEEEIVEDLNPFIGETQSHTHEEMFYKKKKEHSHAHSHSHSHPHSRMQSHSHSRSHPSIAMDVKHSDEFTSHSCHPLPLSSISPEQQYDIQIDREREREREREEKQKEESVIVTAGSTVEQEQGQISETNKAAIASLEHNKNSSHRVTKVTKRNRSKLSAVQHKQPQFAIPTHVGNANVASSSSSLAHKVSFIQRSMSSPLTHLFDLPADWLVFLVQHYFDNRELLLALPLVCKRFRILAANPVCWRSLLLTMPNIRNIDKTPQAFRKFLIRSCSYLTTITIHGPIEPSDWNSWLHIIRILSNHAHRQKKMKTAQ
ncbi:hypothetical protein RFI_28125, partial [Reticulomyxa filosa]